MAREERERMKNDLNHNISENRDLYTYFNDLQSIANEHRLDLHFPELVVVGMQSDGKSSFVEALLGFQFNTIDTQIGTRRPLILQMMNDTAYEQPHCLFWTEDLKKLEDKPTPVNKIESELRRRTDALCGKTDVSSMPIILRVKYKFCANLTIYDLPGFRKGQNDPLTPKIARMVLKLIEPKHRIIVCLEQSTVEWCNTQVRPMVQKVDPNFERTIIVTTKFNNRINQFRSKEEVDAYMSTDGQLTGKSVFFISLPSGHNTRDLAEEEFKEKIMDTYINDYKQLCRIEFDIEKYRSCFGFYSLRKHLETILNSRYKECLVPILKKMDLALEHRKGKLDKLNADMKDIENESIEQICVKIVNSYVTHVNQALMGTNLFDTMKNGFTLVEEKEQSGYKAWPNYDLDIRIRNSQYKLYGGAQLERLLAEFEIVAHSQEFPKTSDDEVAVTIGLNSLHTTPDYDRGASDLAQKKCRSIFQPLIDVLMQRSKFIMISLFKIVIQYMASDPNLVRYSQFFQELKKVSEEFIDKVLIDVRAKTDDEFNTFTKIMDWDLMKYCTSKQTMEYDLLEPKKEDTLKRVQSITEEEVEKFQFFGNDRSRELTLERCQKIKTVAAKLFAGVRLLFVKYIRAKYNAFFLNPIFTEMDNAIRMHFTEMGSDRVKELMGVQILKLKKYKESLTDIVQKLTVQREKFHSLIEMLNNKKAQSSVSGSNKIPEKPNKM
jgi:succinate dehydrogenase flavin-adding protein (antitoxin of CptAB toxin-antitoxin module)